LGRTGHRADQPEGPGLVRKLALVAGAAALLTSCSSGDVDESRRFQAQEAERTQQVPQTQKTELARLFLKPTGTPLATMTPDALLSDLVITTSIGSNGAPTDRAERVSRSAPSVSVAAHIANLATGEVVSVTWLTEQGEVVRSEEKPASGSAGRQWVSFSLPLAGSVGPGVYAAEIRVNGLLLDSIAFQVS
jgi:hypothetical protein